jgi:hypothetical protein
MKNIDYSYSVSNYVSDRMSKFIKHDRIVKRYKEMKVQITIDERTSSAWMIGSKSRGSH